MEVKIGSGELDHQGIMEASQQLGKTVELLEVKSDRWLELSEYT